MNTGAMLEADRRFDPRPGVRLIVTLLWTSVLGLSCDQWTLPPEQAPPQIVRSSAEPFPEVETPNVVWIVLDGCRPDRLSSYGHPRSTSPNIDRLARRGTLFERQYAQAPATLMSVASYMTGRHAPVLYHDPGAQNSWFLRKPPDDEQLVSTIFSDNNYATAMFSAMPWYSKSSTLGSSFDTFGVLAHGPDSGEGSFDARNPELFEWLEHNRADPFFLYLHSMDTHSPRLDNNTAETWLEASFPPRRDAALRTWTGQPYTKRDRKHLENLYDGGIEYADETVGKIVDKLEEMNIRERTLVIVSADHGDILGWNEAALGDVASASYDDLLRVPLIVSGPGFPVGRRIESKTENTDIVPTLVDLLSLQTTARFDGQALGPWLHSDSPEELRRYTYARSMARGMGSEPNMILTFDDIKFDFSPLRSQDFEALDLLPRNSTEIWWAPDYSGTRKAANPPADRVREALDAANDHFKPLWAKTAAIPQQTPTYFDVSHSVAIDDLLVSEWDSPEDDAWMSGRVWVTGAMHQVRLLASHRPTEDAPELKLFAEVPNGTYAVSIYAATSLNNPTRRGASFSFRATGDEDTFRTFAVEAPTDDEPRESWIALGTYTISDGFFRYSLDEGSDKYDTVVGDLRFVRVDRAREVPSESELNAQRDWIRMLGYTD